VSDLPERRYQACSGMFSSGPMMLGVYGLYKAEEQGKDITNSQLINVHHVLDNVKFLDL